MRSSTLGPYGVNQIDYLTGKSDRSARDSFLYYSGKDPSAVRYKNWKMYFAMVSDAPAGFITGVVPYAWTQVVNIKRDPFETSLGEQVKTLMGLGGAIAAPVTAYQYDWNMLPIGQALWLKAEGTTDLYRLPAVAGPSQLQSGAGHAAGPANEVERSERLEPCNIDDRAGVLHIRGRPLHDSREAAWELSRPT
jgi:hypothetical protein